MPQLDHLSVGDTPVDLTVGLDPGCYIGQVAARPAVMGDETLLYATATTAPTDSEDWFRAGHREFFTFTVGDDTPPTWAKSSAAGLVVPVALALIPA